MEASANKLLLHVLTDVDQSEERVGFDGYQCREERFDQYVEHVLDVPTGCGRGFDAEYHGEYHGEYHTRDLYPYDGLPAVILIPPSSQETKTLALGILLKDANAVLNSLIHRTRNYRS